MNTQKPDLRGHERVTPCVHERRANHFGEALSAARGLIAVWPHDRKDDPNYQAALNFVRSVCQSCGEPATKTTLCGPCWTAFRQQPTTPAA